MKYDLLIKCFIAFCVGGIIYKLVSDRCSCNVVEGQNGTSDGANAGAGAGAGANAGAGAGAGANAGAGAGANAVSGAGANAGAGNNNTGSGNNNTDSVNNTDVPIDEIQTFIKTINENIFKKPIKETIKSVIGALQSDKFSEENIPDYIDAVSSFEDFGNNTQALNYIELIVIEISNLDDNEFRDFINGLFNTADYCSTDEDLNAYIISMLLLEYYSIKINNDLTQEYINISNRLSKYIPDIVEKVQKLNKACEGSNKKVKSTIMDVMVHRLFKNNNTIINIGSLDSLVNELNKLDRVYGIVILLCITYIVVRFLGMFSMKVEV